MKGIRPLVLLLALTVAVALPWGTTPARSETGSGASPATILAAAAGQEAPGGTEGQSGDPSSPRIETPASDAAARARTAAEGILAQDPAARVSYDPDTGLVRFIGTDAGHSLRSLFQAARRTNGAPATAGSAAEDTARSFLASNAALFGLADQATELAVMRTQSGEDGGAFVRFQQQAGGTPVLGGELIVQMDRDGNVLSAGGKTLPAPAPGPQSETRPAVDGGQAAGQAKEAVAAAYGADVTALTATGPTLWIYNPRLLGGPGLPLSRLVWRTEVQASDATVRELVLIDAQSGGVALRMNLNETLLYRQVYDMANTVRPLPGTLVRSEGEGPVANNPDANEFYDFAGKFYDYYMWMHARDSIDGRGAALVGTVRYCESGYPCPYDNARWTGTQMVFGRDYTQGLDIVAHELTHGVTQHESNLFYYYESGAINESFSDLWGELVEDYANPGGDPNWVVGEALPSGAIRSMKSPASFGDPETMTAPAYRCDDADSGGVHHNSGVGNKAAFLIANGGQGITGIGTTKTAKIYYTAQTRLLTSAAGYLDLYNALQQACTTLTGSFGITGADCQSLKAALDAVQMGTPSQCRSQPPEAPVCQSGLPRNLFYDNLENTGSGNWAADQNWSYPAPAGYVYATSGVQNLWGADVAANAEYAIRMTRDVVLPPETIPFLRFNHANAFRWGGSPASPAWLAGGVIDYSIDGGANWLPGWVLPMDNGYNGTVAAGPLAGSQAFVGTTYGYRSTRVNLSSLAGRNIRIRFRIGSSYDSTNAFVPGWFLDDIQFYTCVARPAGFRTYAPFVIKEWPWTPAAPALDAINNPAGRPNYAVTWRGVPGAGSYLAAEATAADFSNAVFYEVGAGTSLSRTGQNKGTYYYRVKARNNFGESAWSNVQSTTVVEQTTAPDPPVLMPIGNASGSGNYVVAWHPAAGATSYRLIEDTDQAFLHPQVAYEGALTWLTVTGKQPGVYYYAVRAANAWGTSPWSNVESTAVGPAPGFWQSSDTSQSFTVNSTRTAAYGFTLWVTVQGCSAGPQPVVHGGPDAIVNNGFSFNDGNGQFTGWVTFDSPASGHGSVTLNGYFVEACGVPVAGGPFYATFNWQQSGQSQQLHRGQPVIATDSRPGTGQEEGAPGTPQP